MRQEVDTNGNIVRYAGDWQSIKDPKATLIELFSQSGFTCTVLSEGGSRYTIELKNPTVSYSKKYNVFLANIRNEKRDEREKKIQIGAKDPRVIEDGIENIILGIYCFNASNSLQDLIIAAWSIASTYGKNTSIRGLKIDLLQRAKFEGFASNKFSNNFVYCFRPEFIHYYLKNKGQLYDANATESIATLDVEAPLSPHTAINKIYFGCPGTGKSYQLKANNGADKVYKTTFHPEYDYAAFVGTYKPKSIDGAITYAFAPQIFTNAYVYAYQNPEEHVVLQIEEINRGNCALIFGDIFQLLDRKDNGESEYDTTPDADLADYLKQQPNVNFVDKLKLPSNLSILATMNTSDQSLFPMDSAFKRRWQWEYVPIDLEKAKDITFIANGKSYPWADFLSTVNQKIYNVTKSEDKQMGTFFVSGRSVIEAEEFKNKVMYYLWFDIFKNEEPNETDYIFKHLKDGKDYAFTFSDLFKTKGDDTLLSGFLTRLGLNPIAETLETPETV